MRLRAAQRDAAADLHVGRRDHLDVPYPGGESWRQATARVGQRVLVIGHIATHWALDHHINGAALEDLAAQDYSWREGWEYHLP